MFAGADIRMLRKFRGIVTPRLETTTSHDWVRFLRPNFGDEADNHLMEPAVAGQADYIATRNVRHLRAGELRFPHISVVTPTQLLKERA